MIYLVSRTLAILDIPSIRFISIQQALAEIETWDRVQFDIETDGLDSRINKTILVQFGNASKDIQIVVDTKTIDLFDFKRVIENKWLIGHNLYFDIQFMYNYNIVPLKVYDTMIIEKTLNLGMPSVKKGGLSMSLASVLKRRLNVEMDKSIRTHLNEEGLTNAAITYAAKDVMYLESILDQLLKEAEEKELTKAIRLECSFVPVIAYCTWCGIKLDEATWKEKMAEDEASLDKAIEGLEQLVLETSADDPRFVSANGSLFQEEPLCTLMFKRPGIKGSQKPIVDYIKSLGFNVRVEKDGQAKESIDLKGLNKLKGINDKFLKLYTEYSEAYKVVTTYGITYLNAINPNTGRIHTQFDSLAADTGRTSCNNGDEDSIKINADLARLKGFPTKTDDIRLKCGYPNIQTLPGDEITRRAFVAEEGNYFGSSDWSAIESRLGADIYQEQSMIDEYLYGSGDMHSLTAKKIFKELADVPVELIKDLFPHLRKKAKPVEFSQQFGGTVMAIMSALGCSYEEAEEISQAYAIGFPGIAQYKVTATEAVKKNGYILLNPLTGHKTYWIGLDRWKANQKAMDTHFWEIYAATRDSCSKQEWLHHPLRMKVSKHFKEGSKWERKALNSVTQGTGAICMKEAGIRFFYWIIQNNLFSIVKIVNFVHDEICIEYPKTMPKVGDKLKEIMEETTARYCKSLPIPAEISVGNYWIH